MYCIPLHCQSKTEASSQTFSGVYFSEEYIIYRSGPFHFHNFYAYSFSKKLLSQLDFDICIFDFL